MSGNVPLTNRADFPPYPIYLIVLIDIIPHELSFFNLNSINYHCRHIEPEVYVSGCRLAVQSTCLLVYTVYFCKYCTILL